MILKTTAEETHPTLPLESFWAWVTEHSNCILRAGTQDAVLYDDDSFHWILGQEEQFLLVQLLKGKRMVGELFLNPEPVTYVQGTPSERDDEFVFELIAETSNDRVVVAFFVLCHSFDDDPPPHHAGQPVH